MGDIDWSGIIKAVAPAVIGLGTGLIMNNQNVKNAEGQANQQASAQQTQYQTALANQQALASANQLNANKNVVAPTTKNNTMLYIGLGVGGVVFVSLVVFAVTRK